MIECRACFRRCHLHEGQVGFCAQIGRHEDALYSLAFGVVADASATPIESKPVFHYWPGSRVLSLAGLGCNLFCKFCQNWDIAYRDARDAAGLDAPNLPPEAAAQLALEQGCQGLGWSHNEPTISPMYIIECARAARDAHLFTVCATNGMLTEEAVDELGPWIDVYRVDVKSIQREFFHRVASTPHAPNVIQSAARMRHHFGTHVEVVTNVMPGLNDSDDALSRLASNVVEQVGAQTPWHLTTYIPYAQMTHVPTTPYDTLLRARAIGRREGLRHIYIDHPESRDDADTRCPDCGALAVRRTRSRAEASGVSPHGSCNDCGATLDIRMPTGSTMSTLAAHAE